MAPVFLRRKLAIPPVWQHAIRRERLHAQLDVAAAEGRHVALMAGQGFGKTSLLAAWVAGRPTAWVTLDNDDVGLESFLVHLAAACEGAIAGFASEARAMAAHAATREAARAVLSVLLADLDEQCEQPLALVLDDVHLAASPSLDELLVRMLKLLPPQIQLVWATQGRPTLDMLALVGQRRLTLLGEAELALDLAEVALLEPEATPAEHANFLASSGGWPAARDLSPALLDAYLQQRASEELGADDRALLERLALVDAFEPGATDELVEVTLPPATRDALTARGMLIELGDGRLAVAQPMRAMWRRRFAADTPREERARVWGHIGDALWPTQPHAAIDYWLDARQDEHAAERLAEVVEGWLAAGRLEAVAHALARLGAYADRPELALAAGELHRRWGDAERAEERLQRALEAFELRDDGPHVAFTRLRQAMLAAGQGDVPGARALLEGCATERFDGSPQELDVWNMQGGLALLEGEPAAALPSFERSLALARRAADPYAQARAIHNMGACYTALGEYRRALESYDAGLALGPPHQPPLVWMTPINRALVLGYLARLDQALVAARAALELARRFGARREEGYALRVLGFVLEQGDQPEEARACFETAELLAKRMGDPLALAYSLNFLARLASQQGDGERALGLVARIEEALGGAGAVGRVPEFVHARAEALIAAGRPAEARPLLADLAARARGGNAPLAAEVAKLEALLVEPAPPVPAVTAAPVPAGPAPEIRPRPVRTATGSLVLPAEMRVQCFGPPRVWRHGLPIGDREWTTVKAKHLFLFLLHTPEGAAKAQLFEALYPNEPRSDSSINMNLLRLRKALEPELEKGQYSRYILREEGGRYSFNRQVGLELDSAAFEQALRAARPGSPEEREQLQRAIAFEAGNFLPGIDLDWAFSMRQRFRDRAIEACERLLSLVEDEDPVAARRVVERAIAIDPLNVEFNRERILRDLEAEEAHRALEHYQQFERRFQAELGIPPPEDVADLVRDLGPRA